MRFPKYYKANHSHCWYTNHWHFYLFKDQHCRGLGEDSKQTGFSFKHRIKKTRPELWRHFSIRTMTYNNKKSSNYGTVKHREIQWHLSNNFKGDRILGSKRYLRFKTCL